MTTYYVATRSTYVLVDANNETQARELGRPALAALYRETLGREAAVEIRTVRLATGDEIELMAWHSEMRSGEMLVPTTPNLRQLTIAEPSGD